MSASNATFVPAPRSSTCSGVLGAAVLVALLAGCEDGYRGDPWVTPIADPYGNGSRLCDVLTDAPWEDLTNSTSQGCQAPTPDHNVYVTGVTLVAIDRFDETGDGATGNFYAQDTTCVRDQKPYAGITVFDPSFSPPDLRLADNDVVDVSGTLQEFVGPSGSEFSCCRTLPEIAGTLSFRFDGAASPEPVVVKATDLKVYASARKYFGMLIKVEDVKINGTPSSSGGRYTVPIDVGGGDQTDIPTLDNELYDLQHDGPPLADQETFKSVTGILTYFYSFHIAPRSPLDFEK